MEPYRFTAGSGPLLVSVPHAGVHVPPEIKADLSDAAQALPDTDWHVDRLYDFLTDLDASVLVATHSRYVIDLNRDPEGTPLYPGASETGLCPVTTFDDAPIYRDGAVPDAAQIAERRARFWTPYHAKIESQLAALKARHGVAFLWDAHSIRSRVPRFFEGRLPDLNIGSGGGVTAAPALISAVAESAAAAADSGYSYALDGRFKGGYITRTYGNPGQGVHALQLELSQITYMDEAAPYQFRHELASKIRPVLRRLLETALTWMGAGPAQSDV